MRRFYTHWIPTLHPIPDTRLRDLVQFLEARPPGAETISTCRAVSPPRINPCAGPCCARSAVYAELTLAGVPLQLSIHASGLFLLVTEEISENELEQARFIARAEELFELCGGKLHVHMFSHRLVSFFPYTDNGVLPSHVEIVTILTDNYLKELWYQERRFNQKRSGFIRLIRRPIGRLSQYSSLKPRPWSRNYLNLVLQLLEGRLLFANVSEAVHNCKGVDTFYAGFRVLNVEGGYSHAREHQDAYNTLISLYGDYTGMIGSLFMQAAAISVTSIGLFLTISLWLIANVVDVILVKIAALVCVVVVVYVAGYLLTRRASRRFRRLTEIMIGSGQAGWRVEPARTDSAETEELE